MENNWLCLMNLLNPKSKSEVQISVIQNIENLFDLREEIINFLEIILFKVNTKQNMEKVSKY